MSRQTLDESFHIDLTSQEDRERLRAILADTGAGKAVTMTVGGPAGAMRRSRPGASASYADAMRQVEANYYDAV
mgnify:CR=1 FL=1